MLSWAQVYSFEYCKIFKNTFFYRTPTITASARMWQNTFFEKFYPKIKL